MRRAVFAGLLVAAIAATAAARANASVPAPQSSRVVDRIVAQIEDDIILQSQVRELGSFQQLIEGRAESDDRLLAEIIEQWVVQTEATAAHFPRPASSEVDRELARLTAQFGSPAAYQAKLIQAGLSAAQVRQLLERKFISSAIWIINFVRPCGSNPLTLRHTIKKTFCLSWLRKSSPRLP